MNLNSLKKIILSRGRHDLLTTHKFLKDFVVVVPDTELELYKKTNYQIPEDRWVPIPESVRGLGAVRNWCLDHFKEEILVMFDDDISACINLMRDNMNEEPRKFEDPEIIEQIIWNCALNAKEAKCHVFGFNQTSDKRKFRPEEPFLLKSYFGGCVGFVGRGLKFTEVNKGKVDIDYCLQSLMKHRRVWIDNRYNFLAPRDSNRGGNSEFRNSETLYKEMKFLKRKWGRYLKISTKLKTKERITLNVIRKQPITL